ncbi:phosphodiester glycosidase family protein [Pararhizobium gei]|uniref:phosphodiester glycosidase family protein n=1 Tax=Pararhizobium gei TaxID=1395951 RepID=UPI0023DC6A33|nr:phosphodiester glycosidase family protein [Rhizobium gei]
MFRFLCFGVLMTASAFSSGKAAAACRKVEHLTQPFAVCTFDPTADDIRILHRGRDGRPYGGFDRVSLDLRQEGEYLEFAMNGGMYERDLSSVGLLVTDGVERKALDRGESWGNFYLKPNGVFFLKDGRAGVMETEAYAAAGMSPDFATQSGPMLVIGGALHLAFLPQSDSLQIRNGVGVSKTGEAVFAISLVPVRFHDFATLFRDQLNCPDALFLDGSISSLFAPGLDRYDNANPMGPIIAVVKKAPGS